MSGKNLWQTLLLELLQKTKVSLYFSDLYKTPKCLPFLKYLQYWKEMHRKEINGEHNDHRNQHFGNFSSGFQLVV